MMLQRLAVLVGCPGGVGSRYLSGVTVDLVNYRRYLMSLAGGAWRSSEIEVLMNPSRREWLDFLRGRSSIDYLVTVFSGHGYQNGPNGSVHLSLNSHESIRVSEIMPNSILRRLCIVDACRSYPEEDSAELAGDELFEMAIPPASIRARYREAFDSVVSGSPIGGMFSYACGPGEAANENEHGGIFSQSLLRVARSWHDEYRNTGQPFYLSVQKAWSDVRRLMRNYGSIQQPRLMRTAPTVPIFPIAIAL